MRAIRQDGVAAETRPVGEVARGCDAGLLAPATAFGFRQRVGLGVVVEIERAVVAEQQVGTVEAAVLPWGAVLGTKDGIGKLPVKQVVGSSQADDGGAGFIAGAGVSVPGGEIAAVVLQGFACAVQRSCRAGCC